MCCGAHDSESNCIVQQEKHNDVNMECKRVSHEVWKPWHLIILYNLHFTLSWIAQRSQCHMKPRKTCFIDSSYNIIMTLDDYVACLEQNQQNPGARRYLENIKGYGGISDCLNIRSKRCGHITCTKQQHNVEVGVDCHAFRLSTHQHTWFLSIDKCMTMVLITSKKVVLISTWWANKV